MIRITRNGIERNRSVTRISRLSSFHRDNRRALRGPCRSTPATDGHGHPDDQGDPAAVEHAGELVATERVGAEQVLPRGTLTDRREIQLRVAEPRDQRRRRSSRARSARARRSSRSRPCDAGTDARRAARASGCSVSISSTAAVGSAPAALRSRSRGRTPPGSAVSGAEAFQTFSDISDPRIQDGVHDVGHEVEQDDEHHRDHDPG